VNTKTNQKVVLFTNSPIPQLNNQPKAKPQQPPIKNIPLAPFKGGICFHIIDLVKRIFASSSNKFIFNGIFLIGRGHFEIVVIMIVLIED